LPARAAQGLHLAEPLGQRKPFAQVVVGDVRGEIAAGGHCLVLSSTKVRTAISQPRRREQRHQGSLRISFCAVSISSRSRAGVTGSSRMGTRSGKSASSIAETIAGGAPMVPLSAAPLTPSGLSGVGDSM